MYNDTCDCNVKYASPIPSAETLRVSTLTVGAAENPAPPILLDNLAIVPTAPFTKIKESDSFV